MDVLQMNEVIEDTMKGKYLTFRLGEEIYGLQINFITEIISLQNITGIPDVANYVRGIINLRGKIIPVIDMRLRFKKDPIGYTDRTCIVVVDYEGIAVGCIVDKVLEVISIADTDLLDPPTGELGFHNPYIHKIGRVGADVKLLIDLQKVFEKFDYHLKEEREHE